ncbi:hypothetical protein Cni_G10100 [Canna indica]|uniref:Protein kinase domain-containing protein n=1 Tax=Canna indica TaxID=4628 RepID=A0AAQ3K579_9LILI|nr:hypothetical protein Cni_G10100 [Canna indica]
MASGRYGRYRHHKFRRREVDVGVTIGRKDFYQDRLRNGSHDRDRVQSFRGVRDRVSIRERHIKEGEVVDGSYRYPMSSNSSGGSSRTRRMNHLSRSDADRESGELSSESGSDDAGAPISKIREIETQNQDNGYSSMSTRKRIYSPPIIWDISTVATSYNKNNKTEHLTLPLPPSLLRGFVHSYSTEVVGSSIENVFPVDEDFYVDSPQGQLENSDQEARLTDEYGEELGPTRNISSSRWVDENSILDDEDVPFKEDPLAKRRKISPSDSVAQWLEKKMPTTKLGEITGRENSRGALTKLLDSDREIGSNNHHIEVSRLDYMDVEGDSSYVDSRVRTSRPALPPQRCINMLQGSRSVDEFEKLNKINEGTYGVVYRAKDKKTGEIVALKKIKMKNESEGFPLTSLREIDILLSFHHPSIVNVNEVVVGSSLDSIFMVMEYMEHDLKGLLETMKQPFSESEVKCLMLQLLLGVKYLHDNWVLHRDLKTSNLLLNNCGELKICDFGLSRQYGSPLKPYTPLVVTLWYRALELLLGAKEYSTAIDMWSLGCIMAELLSKEPLFNGKTEFDQLDKIFRTLGTPNERIWPEFSKLPGIKVNFVKQPYNKLREKFPLTSFYGRPTLSETGFDLLNKLLSYDPNTRITAEAALDHHWFHEVALPKSKYFMPTFPQHAKDRVDWLMRWAAVASSAKKVINMYSAKCLNKAVVMELQLTQKLFTESHKFSCYLHLQN